MDARQREQLQLQDRDLAQDAAQTALMKLLLHATDFRPDRDVVAWALGFASFECLSARNRGLSRGGSIVWLHDEERAFAESRRTGRPVLVEAWAEWCTACKLMDRNTWSDPDVQREVRSRFIPLRIDFTEESPASNARREVYGVDGLPTVLSCRSAGCADPTATRATGYLRPAEMLPSSPHEGEASADRWASAPAPRVMAPAVQEYSFDKK